LELCKVNIIIGCQLFIKNIKHQIMIPLYDYSRNLVMISVGLFHFDFLH